MDADRGMYSPQNLGLLAEDGKSDHEQLHDEEPLGNRTHGMWESRQSGSVGHNLRARGTLSLVILGTLALTCVLVPRGGRLRFDNMKGVNSLTVLANKAGQHHKEDTDAGDHDKAIHDGEVNDLDISEEDVRPMQFIAMKRHTNFVKLYEATFKGKGMHIGERKNDQGICGFQKDWIPKGLRTVALNMIDSSETRSCGMCVKVWGDDVCVGGKGGSCTKSPIKAGGEVFFCE